jgi:hypothetical protein
MSSEYAHWGQNETLTPLGMIQSLYTIALSGEMRGMRVETALVIRRPSVMHADYEEIVSSVSALWGRKESLPLGDTYEKWQSLQVGHSYWAVRLWHD